MEAEHVHVRSSYLFTGLFISSKKMISWGSCLVFIMFSAIAETLNNTMGPMWYATSAGSIPKKQGKIMTYKKVVELLDLYHRLRFAAVLAQHFKINESSVRTIAKKRKGNSWSCHCSHQQTWKPRLCAKYIFKCHRKCAAFMWEGLLLKAYLQTLILRKSKLL